MEKISSSALFVKARRAQQSADLANGDVTSILDMIAGLQQQVADLTDALALTDERVAELTTQLSTTNENAAALAGAYELHTHSYTDVDNPGVTTTKITTTPA